MHREPIFRRGAAAVALACGLTISASAQERPKDFAPHQPKDRRPDGVQKGLKDQPFKPSQQRPRDRVTAAHREALIRYLEASRTTVIIRHFGLPIMIRAAAVERWGFDFTTLGADQILAMESKLEAAELEDELVELHARHLTKDEAMGIARFYESEPGRRIMADRMRTMLPSTDPLLSSGLPAPTEQDQQALVAFMQTRTGIRLNSVGFALARELAGAQEAFADRAVERYVAERGLPNRRK